MQPVTFSADGPRAGVRGPIVAAVAPEPVEPSHEFVRERDTSGDPETVAPLTGDEILAVRAILASHPIGENEPAPEPEPEATEPGPHPRDDAGRFVTAETTETPAE